VYTHLNIQFLIVYIPMKFSYTTKQTDTSIEYYINWPEHRVDIVSYTELVKLVQDDNDYAPLTPDKLQDIKRRLTNKLPDDTIVAIRTIIVKNKIIKSHHKLTWIVPQVDKHYDNIPLVDLARRRKMPPLTLWRAILEYRGFSVAEIFAARCSPEDILTGWDLKQFMSANEADIENIHLSQHIAKIAAFNEDTFVQYFKSIGIKLQTQEDLTIDQIAKFGRPINTPDLLFIDVVYINGNRIHWIDYKDYIATEISFLYTSNAKQSARYVNEWGPGVLCYHRGVIEGVTIPNTILLDTSDLPIKLRNL